MSGPHHSVHLRQHLSSCGGSIEINGSGGAHRAAERPRSASKGHEDIIMDGQRTIIVTGSGRGIGRTVAQAFARQGDAVVVADLVEERAQETVDLIRAGGGAGEAVRVDVRTEASVAEMVARAFAFGGRIDVLVNGAGGYGQAFRATHETPEEEWDLVLESNLKGSFLCAKHVIPHMIAQGCGRIINFSSNAGRSTSPLLGASYTAAKAGVFGLSRHLAIEYASKGILVNTIAPGPVNGDRVGDLLPSEGKRDSLATQIPLGRLAEFEDISDVVLFMASDASRFMTGAILDVNGGYVLA
ncbi:SDR family NAD(P)-dependent oxidoreductase [Roseixanthobacter pseudopolyaromaticivorans]|uniref:SDR family NAD(P)-dependent oxidoreductase n=1 Tax=Xanthobacteraceae TaxID=335928 RepID=UPI003727A8C5